MNALTERRYIASSMDCCNTEYGARYTMKKCNNAPTVATDTLTTEVQVADDV